jgi:Kdo2-lipid IVA lauroyltransferase/acyltransferase
MQATGFYVFYVFIWLFTLLPFRFQYLVSDLLAFLMHDLVRYRKKTVMLNLRKSFPEKTEEELRSIGKAYYHHMCDEMIETFQLIHMKEEQILSRFRIVNPGLIKTYYDSGRSIVAVFGHYGNWEWLAALPLSLPHEILALYRPLHNPYFDRMMFRLRSRFGVIPVPVNRTLQEILSRHQQKIPAMTLFLGDQSPARIHIQHWTRFMNQDTAVFLGAEKISVKLNQVVLFIKISKTKRGHYEAEFIPLFEEPSKTSSFEITEKHLSVLETIIREEPAYWLWSHQRWKYIKPATGNIPALGVEGKYPEYWSSETRRQMKKQAGE